MESKVKLTNTATQTEFIQKYRFRKGTPTTPPTKAEKLPGHLRAMVFSYLEVHEIIEVVSKLTVRDRENLLNCQYMFYPISINIKSLDFEFFDLASFWVQVATGNLEIGIWNMEFTNNQKGLLRFLLQERKHPLVLDYSCYIDLIPIINSLGIKKLILKNSDACIHLEGLKYEKIKPGIHVWFK